MADRSASRNWRRPEKRSEQIRIVAVGAAILVIFSVGLLLWVLGQDSFVATNENLCPQDRAPSEVVVLLLDVSDELNERQRLKVENEIAALLNGVKPFGLIEVYSIEGAGAQVLRPMSHLCNPGTGEDLNLLYQNPGIAKKRWLDFSERLKKELSTLMMSSGAAVSPIMEGIQATALRTFNLPAHQDLRKRLYVVSDLLQHVPGRLSHYSFIPEFAAFLETPYSKEVRADLRGVEVTLLYVVRSSQAQPWPEHRLFWEEYFRFQGATVERLEPVFGGK